MSLETETYKGHEIKIETDLNSESPREWDNLCIIHVAHRNYSIGDVNHNDAESIKAAEREAKKNGDVCLPLYMFNHSGITISLSPFSCKWDSGQVGFVQIPRKKMLEEFDRKIFTSKLKQKGREIATAEVETLDVYIRGDVCGFDIDDAIDSCWGFYSVKEAMAEAKSIVDWMVNDTKKKHFDKVKTWIKNNVPFEARYSMKSAQAAAV